VSVSLCAAAGCFHLGLRLFKKLYPLSSSSSSFCFFKCEETTTHELSHGGFLTWIYWRRLTGSCECLQPHASLSLCFSRLLRTPPPPPPPPPPVVPPKPSHLLALGQDKKPKRIPPPPSRPLPAPPPPPKPKPGVAPPPGLQVEAQKVGLLIERFENSR